MKRRTELMEEANTLQAFTIGEGDTEEDKHDREKFMRLTRKAHLERLHESLLEQEKVVQSCMTAPSLPAQPPLLTLNDEQPEDEED